MRWFILILLVLLFVGALLWGALRDVQRTAPPIIPPAGSQGTPLPVGAKQSEAGGGKISGGPGGLQAILRA